MSTGIKKMTEWMMACADGSCSLPALVAALQNNVQQLYSISNKLGIKVYPTAVLAKAAGE